MPAAKKDDPPGVWVASWAPASDKPGRKMSKKTEYIIIGCAAGAAVAIALGLGLGLGLKHRKKAAAGQKVAQPVLPTAPPLGSLQTSGVRASARLAAQAAPIAAAKAGAKASAAAALTSATKSAKTAMSNAADKLFGGGAGSAKQALGNATSKLLALAGKK
jgi:hypothetical protein